MDFLISAVTDIGTKKDTNQDGMTVKILETPMGRMVFAVMCDGMGGLAKGEVASTSVIVAFHNWCVERLPQICNSGLSDAVIRKEWENIVFDQNDKIHQYGAVHNIQLGTTLVAMLITQQRYYIMNIGDTRAYEIFNDTVQITEDQTFIAREIKYGRMTPEQAETDPRRNVLLQCIGASDDIIPDMFFGAVKKDAVYMICCDGFRHEISPAEMYQKFKPEILTNTTVMNANSRTLIELNKERAERDNISVVLIKTY